MQVEPGSISQGRRVRRGGGEETHYLSDWTGGPRGPRWSEDPNKLVLVHKEAAEACRRR